MSARRERVAVAGGGKTGLEILALLNADPETQIVLLVDEDPAATAFHLQDHGFDFADGIGLSLSRQLEDLASSRDLDWVVDATGDPAAHQRIASVLPMGAALVTAPCAQLIWELRHARRLDMDQAYAKALARQSLAFQRIKSAVESIDLAGQEIEFFRLLLSVAVLATVGSRAVFTLIETTEPLCGFCLEKSVERSRFRGSLGRIRAATSPIVVQVVESKKPALLRAADDPSTALLLRHEEARSIAAVPLMDEDRVLGVLSVSADASGVTLGEMDASFLSQLAGLSERYLKKLLALREVREVTEFETLRREMKGILESDAPIQGRLDRALKALSAAFHLDGFSIYVRDPQTGDLTLQSSDGINPQVFGVMRARPGSGILLEMVSAREPMLLEGGPASCLLGEKYLPALDQVPAVLYLPLTACLPAGAAAGKGVGVLVLEIGGRTRLAPRNIAILRELADLLASSISGDAERYRMSQKVMKLSAVNEEGLELLSATDREKVLLHAAAASAMILDAEAVVLRIYQREQDRLLVGATYGLHQDEMDEALVDLDLRIAMRAMERKTLLSLKELQYEDFPFPEGFPYRAALCFPLFWEDRPLGTLSLYNKLVYHSFSCTSFGPDDEEILEKFSQYVGKALLNVQEFRERQTLITIDELTGLRNERYLHMRLPEEVKRADRYDRKISLIFLEIDRFGELTAGMRDLTQKALIRKIASVVRDSFRHVDIIVRLKEARFAVLMPDTGERAEEAIGRLVKNLSGFRVRRGEEVEPLALTLLVGSCTYPHEAADAQELIQKALVVRRKGAAHGYGKD